jgi:hypothetical protein
MIEFDHSAHELVINQKGAKALGVSAPRLCWRRPIT